MIDNMQEIEERFDEIKDHKPKATKKLNELGEILASAYQLDPNKADEMWQYLVELNVSEDEKNAKFYIAQVFNKIVGLIPEEDATILLAMHPDRVRSMIINGYDGATLYKSLAALVIGFIKGESLENALVVFDYFFEKFGGITSKADEIVRGSDSLKIVYEWGKDDSQYIEDVSAFMKKMSECGNEPMEVYSLICLLLLGEETDNLSYILDKGVEYHFEPELIEVIWEVRNVVDEQELKERWEYLCQETRNFWKLTPLCLEDNDEYEESKLHWYVNVADSSPLLLDFYFSHGYFEKLQDSLVRKWIEEGEWEKLQQYIAKLLLNIEDDGNGYKFDSVWRRFSYFLEPYFYDEYRDNSDEYGRSYKIFNEQSIHEFCSSLAKISAMITGCACQSKYHERIKEFIEKATGNVDVLNEVGFEETVDGRTPKEKYLDYIHSFLQSGETEHQRNSQELYKLRQELNSTSTQIKIEINIDKLLQPIYDQMAELGIEREKVETVKEKPVNNKHESLYEFACNDEVVDFYYLHCAHEFSYKADMLAICVLKGDINRAIEIVEKMIKTSEYDDYSERNSWELELKNTIIYLIRNFELDRGFLIDKDEITNEMQQQVKQIALKALPYLDTSSKSEVRAELIALGVNEDGDEEYIDSLMNDVEIYSTFPKPRGYGNAPTINRISSEVMNSFKVLSNIGREDVICAIFRRFYNVKEQLKPVPLGRWVQFLVTNGSPKACVEVYKNNRELFEWWLSDKGLPDYAINLFAHKFADYDRAVLIDYSNLVTSRHGSVINLDDYPEITLDD